MRKIILTALTAVLCLNFTVCASAEYAVTEADDGYSYAEDGGLVPTTIDESIKPEFVLTEEYIPVTSNHNLGANEIVPAVRDDGEAIVSYVTMADLWQSWFENPDYKYDYPDYVCGVWTETGDMSQLVVAVTKDEKGEKGKEEILSLIEKDDSVKFTYQSYSYNELRDVQEQITPFMGEESGIYGIGVYEMDNKVHANVDGTNPNAKDYMNKFLGQYGDMIVFEVGEGGIVLDAATEEFVFAGGGSFMDGGMPAVTMEELAVITETGITSEKQDNVWIFAVCAAAVILLIAVIAFTVNRVNAKQTTAGVVTEGGTRLSAADTEAAVRNSTEAPGKDILSEIMKEIEK